MRKQLFVIALTLVASFDMFFVFAPYSITYVFLLTGVPFFFAALASAAIYALFFYGLARRLNWFRTGN